MCVFLEGIFKRHLSNFDSPSIIKVCPQKSVLNIYIKYKVQPGSGSHDRNNKSHISTFTHFEPGKPDGPQHLVLVKPCGK